MAVTYNNSGDSGWQSGVDNYSFSFTVNAGTKSVLSCQVGCGKSAPSATVSSITYAGAGLTQVPSARSADGLNEWMTDIWRKTGPATGSNTVAVQLSGVASGATGCVALDGVDQASPTNTPATAAGTTNPTITVTSAVGEIAIDVVGQNGQGGSHTVTMVAHAGRTQRWNVFPAGTDATCGSTMDGAAPNITMDWTSSDSPKRNCMSAVSYKADSGGGGRTTHNTVAAPLGVEIGMGFGTQG